MPPSIRVWHGRCESKPPHSNMHRRSQSVRDNDITDNVFLTFSAEDESFGEVRTVPLKPGGENIDVTNENKREYIE